MKLSKIRILHLEDEDTDAELIARFLKKNGVDFEARVVNTKDQYQNALQEYKPEIILSDHSLPEFNSIEALEMLRASDLDIPFILVTGAVSEDFGIAAIMKGVDDYILKDRLNRLPVAIENALNKYKALRNQKIALREKEEARNRVEESEKQYVQLVRDLPAAICRCDANGRILLYNKAATELWGRVPEVDQELWCGSLSVFDSDNQPLVGEALPMARAIRSGVKGKVEIRIERPDGTSRFVMSHLSPSFDSTGRVSGGSNVMIDITEIKKANVQSLLLVDRLQLKNKELSQFGYMISHNLRAPIARILGLASIFDVDPQENRFIIDKITEATNDLDEIVRDINVVISARDSENEKKETVWFETQLRLVKQVLAREIAKADAKIVADFSAARGVYTVKTYLYSTLYNLISNAIKFRNPNVRLVINIHSFKKDNAICLSVKDNGLGMDLTRYGSKIFGLYNKFNIAVPGKGIGLHLVKVQIDSLGGKIEVDSKVNEGTEFLISLPVHAYRDQ